MLVQKHRAQMQYCLSNNNYDILCASQMQKKENIILLYGYTVNEKQKNNRVVKIKTPFQESIETLERISKLPFDWNGNNASPFSKTLIKKAEEIILKLHRQPEIFPTAAKSIQFEYDCKNGDYLEFNIYESGKIVYYKRDKNKSSEVREIEEKELVEIVEDFDGRQLL